MRLLHKERKEFSDFEGEAWKTTAFVSLSLVEAARLELREEDSEYQLCETAKVYPPHYGHPGYSFVDPPEYTVDHMLATVTQRGGLDI